MNLSQDLQGLKKKAKETFLYVLSALLLGIAIGAIDAVFGRVLLFITDFRSAHVVVLLPFLPLAGLGIVWLYRHFNETASKGMTLVMEAGQGKRESIPLALIPLVMAGTWITHLFGGSAGREGVAVQIGATLSHAFARRFHFPDNGRIVLIAGMAAGFGGLFQTPFAAVFFAMEVVVSGSMAYSALLPAAIASFTASATSHALGLEKFSVLLSQTLSLTDTKTVTYLILFGILFGLTGRLFAVLLQKVKQFMGNVLENPYKRIGFVSIPLAVFLFLAWNGRYCGLGTNLIAQAFSGGLDFEAALYGTDFVDRVSGRRGDTAFFHRCIAWFCAGKPGRTATDGLRGTWIRGGVWKCNQYFAGSGSDRNGSIWCGKWACIFCGLPGGISGQWQALHLYGTETVFLVKNP